MSIQRWDLFEDILDECDSGEWVLFDDHEAAIAEEREKQTRRLIRIGLGKVSIGNARHTDDLDGPERMVVIRELDQQIPIGEDAGDGDMVVSEDDEGVLAIISIENPENSYVLMEHLILAIEAAYGHEFDDPDHAFQGAYVRAIKANAAFKSELAEAKAQCLTWIDPGDELPPNQMPVFVRIKSPYNDSIWHGVAEYILQGTVPAIDYLDSDVDIDKDGNEWTPEGWYEVQMEHEDIMMLSWDVVAWAKIPKMEER